MREMIIRYSKKYPNKRIIGHFMQPHFPFIGPTGKDIPHSGIKDETDLPLWHKVQFKRDGISEKIVWKGYRENLEIVLELIGDELLDQLSGKTVITSDHGNLIGDRTGPIPAKGYGHPSHLHVDPLLTVPWFEVPFEERRRITSDPPKEPDTVMETDELNDRLEDLGYL